jgi:hypothetical protein
MNTFQPSNQRVLECGTSLSANHMPGTSNNEAAFGYGIDGSSFIWADSIFPGQAFPIIDMPTGPTELQPSSDAIGKSLLDDVAVPQACSCTTAEYVLDLQIRVANLEEGCGSRLGNLEAKFEEL